MAFLFQYRGRGSWFVSVTIDKKRFTDNTHTKSKACATRYLNKYYTGRTNEEITKRLSRTGYIYIIKAHDLYKIGRTLDPEARFTSLKGIIPCPIEVVLLERVPCYDLAERSLHYKYRGVKVKCEWFKLGNAYLKIIRKYLENWKARYNDDPLGEANIKYKALNHRSLTSPQPHDAPR